MGLFSAFVYSLIFLSFPIVSSESNGDHETKTFIVGVQNDLKPSHYSNVVDWYSSTLRSLSSRTSNDNDNMIVHVYKTAFHGFSAKLTSEQAHELNQRPEILGVFPDQFRKIQTTRSPAFLGLDLTSSIVINNLLLNDSDCGSNTIIGVLDTGIWPERRSFNDEGLGPIPSRWKGECNPGDSIPKFTCNKKLIGARYFARGYEARFGELQNKTRSARDALGHGTHTASTAAGRRVENVSFFGYANGVSSGIAPKARIAVYKVCWEDTDGDCADSDIMAAIDSAVDDGVDVISVSIGPASPVTYDVDPIALTAFGAVQKGVVFSAAAGNAGGSQTVTNAAPWITTVGAGTLDRTFPADLVLRDGRVITGLSLYSGNLFPAGSFFPLVYAGNDTQNKKNQDDWNFCQPGELDPELVKGKIVICDFGNIPASDKGIVVKEAGGVGVIVGSIAPFEYGEGLTAQPYLTPGISITESARATLLSYIKSSKNPRATMRFRGTQLRVKPAPMVSFFSSRGPNGLSPDVLKPDVIAPGVDILAAWPDGVSPSGTLSDTRSTEFNIVSGTSMSCPHVSGIAALLKGAHPDWTPAMIKSAMMTTAYTHDQDQKPIQNQKNHSLATVWDMGAGHVDPVRAADPGLVYDLTEDDYIRFLCSSNFNSSQVSKITSKVVDCQKTKKTNTWELNYPAIGVQVKAAMALKVEFRIPRTVTQVSDGTSTYTVKVTNPSGTAVSVSPAKMMFGKKGDKKSYVLKISVDNSRRVRPVSEVGVVTWTDGKHRVTSAVVVTWVP